ncbi:hypothetical protein ACOMCU_01175 [Lysinibacillus sp. UGB7]|uniref:hypothetical protein n=1 Tax=Lysinibacillus sp. UGB7 TaxID=3411039 RepID=UPI003B81944D
MVINGLLTKKALFDTFRLSTLHVDACSELEDWIENKLRNSLYESYVGFIDLFGVNKAEQKSVFEEGYVSSYLSFVSVRKQNVINSGELEHAEIIEYLEQEESLSSRYRNFLMKYEVNAAKRNEQVVYLNKPFWRMALHGTAIASLIVVATTFILSNY